MTIQKRSLPVGEWWVIPQKNFRATRIAPFSSFSSGLQIQETFWQKRDRSKTKSSALTGWFASKNLKLNTNCPIKPLFNLNRTKPYARISENFSLCLLVLDFYKRGRFLMMSFAWSGWSRYAFKSQPSVASHRCFGRFFGRFRSRLRCSGQFWRANFR